MINPTLEQSLHEQLEQLPLEQQDQVLEFARHLAVAGVRGVPGRTLLSFGGTIEEGDLATMTQAIEEGCEAIYPNE
jgi:hypothetical protein